MINDYTAAGVSAVMVGGVVGGVVILLVVVLLCGFGAGVIEMSKVTKISICITGNSLPSYFLSTEKVERSARGGMVINPLYGESDGLYEELPENVPTSTAPTAVPAQPSTPPPRHAGQTDIMKSEREEKLGGCLSSTPDNHSISSSFQQDDMEDCYTVMSPAGTLTMLPRNRHSAASLGGSTPWPLSGAP